MLRSMGECFKEPHFGSRFESGFAMPDAVGFAFSVKVCDTRLERVPTFKGHQQWQRNSRNNVREIR
jgi:hypothetical protein